MAQNIFGSKAAPRCPAAASQSPWSSLCLRCLPRAISAGRRGARARDAEAARSCAAVPSDPSPGSILDGLGGLIKQFQQKGLGDTVDSWVATGKNKNVAPDQVSVALGGDRR